MTNDRLRNFVYGFCPACKAMYGRWHTADCAEVNPPEPKAEATEPDPEEQLYGLYGAWPIALP